MVGFLLKELLLNSPKMGRFNDLPKDVVWLIFRRVIVEHFCEHYVYPNMAWHEMWEEGQHLVNRWNDCTLSIAELMSRLSLLNRDCLKLVRLKCFKFESGWFFIKGAISL